MSFRYYIISMFFATLLAWGVWLLVIFSLDPATAGEWGLFSFYASLFLSLLGTFTILESLLRRFFIKDKVLFRQAIISFRQAFFLSFFFVFALFLQAQRLLSWGNIFLLALILLFLELLASFKKKIIS